MDIIAYHGSTEEFTSFDLSKAGTVTDYGTLGHGIYFSLNKEVAEHYAGDKGYIYTCKITLDHPLIIDTKAKETWLTTITFEGVSEISSDAKQIIYNNYNKYLKDYDGVIAYWDQIQDIVLDHGEVCVFDPKNIEILKRETSFFYGKCRLRTDSHEMRGYRSPRYIKKM